MANDLTVPQERLMDLLAKGGSVTTYFDDFRTRAYRADKHPANAVRVTVHTVRALAARGFIVIAAQSKDHVTYKIA